MAVRSAEEAGLNAEPAQRNVRPKLGDGLPLSHTETPQEDVSIEDATIDSLAIVDLPDPDPFDLHGWTPETIFENVEKSQRKLWIADPDPKVLAYKAYGGRIESIDDILKIGDIIKTALSLSEPPAIAPPIPESLITRKDAPPYCALITGISLTTAEELISRKFISTPDVSLFLIPFAPDPSMFITTLKGFLFPRESKPTTKNEVKNIFIRTIFDGGEDSHITVTTKRMLANFRDNIPQPLNTSVQEAIRFLKATVVVRRFDLVKKEDIGIGESRGHPAWNVYIAPPTKDHETFRKWVDHIRQVRFITKGNGPGQTRKIFSCNICRSEDHPGGMCPFPTATGWHAPPPPRVSPVDDIINLPTARPSSRNEVIRRASNRSISGRSPNVRGRGQRI